MVVSEAQRDIRRAYVGGGPGVLASGIMWLIAALAQQWRGIGFAFVVLFLGGMLIFPISTFASRTLFRREREASGNPLGLTALESTIAMIGGLFAAWLLLPLKPSLVFPLAAISVGTHYAAFNTVYGDRLFWALAAIITATGLFDILVMPLLGGVAFAVALVELSFGAILTIRASRSA
jgi:hypothetical protein